MRRSDIGVEEVDKELAAGAQVGVGVFERGQLVVGGGAGA